MPDEKTPREQEMIQHEYDALLQDYLTSNHRRHVEIIEKAFHFAKQAHKGITRLTGEPYIMHPLAVARIVVKEIGLGSTSICAALLHDVVEDTEYTTEDIAVMFGEKIASIVDGLTKISGEKFAEHAQEQAENFRKLLLTMSDDARVVLIKLADRLHNMRTLSIMRPAKQQKIIGETQYIYIPLAHRIGLFRIKTELENLCFKYEHPELYREIEQKLADTQIERDKVYEKFIEPIQEKLTEMDFNFKLNERVKSVYSIWNKMQTKHVPFEEVYDILAVRIIFEPNKNSPLSEKEQCWRIYSVITSIYKAHPERTRDWLSNPKSNGYESLHLTVMSTDGHWVEVQIRSTRMDEIAKKGLAAHWHYKTGEEKTELDKWLETIREQVLENPEPDAVDFLDNFKLNLYADELFVFTPKGEMKIVAQGTTALDFAFQLHSDLGVHCIGAKANLKLVPLSYVLQGGDQVEILTSKKQHPQPEWLDYVRTGRAKSRINAYFRRADKILISQGERKLENALKNIDFHKGEAISKLISRFDLKKREDLFLKIAKDDISMDEILEIIKAKPQNNSNQGAWLKYLTLGFFNSDKKDNNTLKAEDKKINKKETLFLSEHDYQLAGCCHPIPGDDIVCFVNDEEQISVHKAECPVAIKLKANYGKQIVHAEWSAQDKVAFPAVIALQGIDQVGILNKVIDTISKNAVNITQVKTLSEDGMFNGKIHLHVRDVQALTKLTKEISRINGIVSAQRVED